MRAFADGRKCEVCGADLPAVYARVTVKWPFASDGKMLFGGPLDPGGTRRVMCPTCFSRMADATALRLDGKQ